MTQKLGKKRAYSLIEILVAISLILLVTAGVGISINKAIQQQRFNTTKKSVVNMLQLAQYLAKLTNADATVVIVQKD